MPETKFSKPFRSMAERVERGEESDFGGAYTIVLPDGKVLEGMISARKDAVMLLSDIHSHIKETIDGMAQQSQPGFGRR